MKTTLMSTTFTRQIGVAEVKEEFYFSDMILSGIGREKMFEFTADIFQADGGFFAKISHIGGVYGGTKIYLDVESAARYLEAESAALGCCY